MTDTANTTSTEELAGNYALSGGEADPEFVAERLQDVQEEQTARAEQARQHETVKSRLEAKRDSQRRTVTVMGERVAFRPVGMGVTSEAMQLRQRVLEGDDPSAEGELVEMIFDVLADHAVDDEMDRDWWAAFPMDVVRQAFEELALGNMSAEERREVEEFRSQ